MDVFNQKIHVLHLIGSTGLYGAERWILALMGATAPNRVEFTLANLVDCKGDDSEVVAAARNRGLNAFDFYTGGTFNPLAPIRLARWARIKGVRIMHGHGFKSDVIGLLASRLSGCMMITTLHGWSLEKDLKLRFYEQLDRVLLCFMDAVCPLSLDLEKSIRSRVRPEMVKLIYNGVDVDEVKAARAVDRRYPNSYVIGYVGRLVPSKGLNTLLSGFGQVCKAYPEARLVIVGDGPEKSALQQIAADIGILPRIEFLGFQSNAVGVLKSFDLFILPSFTEGIPRSLMEAMTAGIPVIASDIPGNRMIVRHGETGILFDPGNTDDLARKIINLIKNPAEGKTMAIRANRMIQREYSSRRMAEEYTEVYYKLIADSNAL